MKVGDVVTHKDSPEYGKGKVLAFQPKAGTVLVKLESFKSCTYHTVWALAKESKE